MPRSKVSSDPLLTLQTELTQLRTSSPPPQYAQKPSSNWPSKHRHASPPGLACAATRNRVLASISSSRIHRFGGRGYSPVGGSHAPAHHAVTRHLSLNLSSSLRLSVQSSSPSLLGALSRLLGAEIWTQRLGSGHRRWVRH